jgi:uncharacterized membrane protein HdeD (DUF308 family)
MKTATLYVIAGVVTGLHNFYRIMDMVNGAPVPLLNCAALLGSVMLLAAAVLVLFRPRVAAKVGLTGSLLSSLVGVLLGPILIIATTVNSILLVRRHRIPAT